jgi:hypothetical protein
MGVVIMELNSKWVVFTELQWVTTYTPTCLLALTTYKYDELQISFATQKLNCKASYKTLIFLVVNVNLLLIFQRQNFIWFKE